MSESSFELVQSIHTTLKDLKQQRCMVCDRRRGNLLMARYRLKEETGDDVGRNMEILKEVRPLRICGWCVHKTDLEGEMQNGRITIMEIMGEEVKE